MVKCFGSVWGLIFIGVSVFGSCDTSGSKKIESPVGYNFSAGNKLPLFSDLREVSGIAFLPASDSILMAINDEEGHLYAVNINNPEVMANSFKFAGKGDYEDITFFKGTWQVLQSNGLIYTGDLANPDWSKPPRILPKDEYEGMAADHDTLFVICKECPKNMPGTATIFLLKSADDSLYIENTIQLDAGEFIKKEPKKILASALARHPITQEWFILSHLNGNLVITDQQFKVKQLIKLPRSLFSQPEGIAFSPNGDLYISNEGDKGAGYILQFKYKE